MKMQSSGKTMDEALDQVRAWMISSALMAESGHIKRTADRLGIHYNTLTRMMRRLKMPEVNMTIAQRRLHSGKAPQSVYEDGRSRRVA